MLVAWLQEMIEQHVNWNDDIGEWQLRCVAYTGNNMRKQTPQPEKDKDKVGVQRAVSVSELCQRQSCVSVKVVSVSKLCTPVKVSSTARER